MFFVQTEKCQRATVNGEFGRFRLRRGRPSNSSTKFAFVSSNVRNRKTKNIFTSKLSPLLGRSRSKFTPYPDVVLWNETFLFKIRKVQKWTRIVRNERRWVHFWCWCRLSHQFIDLIVSNKTMEQSFIACTAQRQESAAFDLHELFVQLICRLNASTGPSTWC